MGLLQDGNWVDQWYDTKASDGHFLRKSSQFRNWVTPEGDAGPTGIGGFRADFWENALFTNSRADILPSQSSFLTKQYSAMPYLRLSSISKRRCLLKSK